MGQQAGGHPMKPSLWVADVRIDTVRKVYLPGGKLPLTRFQAGRSFIDFAPKGALLGVYSDPLLNCTEETHEFVVALLSVVDANEHPDWHSESELPNRLTPRDLRIVFDAFCFSGVPLSR